MNSKSAAVHCSYHEMQPIELLKEHPRNANFHPDLQIGLLAKILLSHGWRAPIVVSTRSGFITKGHGRLDAARRAGLREVPVEFQDYATEKEELADMVADNRLAELGDVDQASLDKLVAEIAPTLEGLSLSDTEFDALIGKTTEPTRATRNAVPERLGDAQKQYNIIFDSPEQQNQWFAYIKFLRARYPDCETIAARIIKDIRNFNAGPPLPAKA